MQCLKNHLQSKASVSSINPISTDVFPTRNRLQEMGVKLSPYFFLGRELLFIDLKLGTQIKNTSV